MKKVNLSPPTILLRASCCQSPQHRPELGGSTLNQNRNGKVDLYRCMFRSNDEFFYNDLLGIGIDFSGKEKRCLSIRSHTS